MKYRKRPLVIDAVKWDGSADTANSFLGEQFGTDWWYESREGLAVIIPTLEGNMRAEVGDYLIRGIKGEFYPRKADIFEATYEPAEEQGVPT